jgi:hypothetical protein
MLTSTACAPEAQHVHAAWMPWTGRNWPATTREEQAFVARLTEIAPPRQGGATRSDITAVLNALRCGLTVDELLDRAPGLAPGRLLDAYHMLDTERAESEHAWHEIVAVPNLETFVRRGPAAARLLPAAITGLRSVAELHLPSLADAVAELAERVAAAQERVRRLEDALDRLIPPSPRGVELGRQLYDPISGGATSHADYLPTRVGTLVPTRVAALLGERVDVGEPTA